MQKPVTFSIIGGAGFRAQYFLRIAQALPEQFRVSGMVVRDEAKGQAMEEQWHVATYRELDQLLAKERPDFVVLSVKASAAFDYMAQLTERGIPVLAETPPAPDLEGLLQIHDKLTRKGARIQVAEQYQFHPVQEARTAMIQSGQLGNINQVTVSISQLYHAVSLIRTMLGVRFEQVKIKGMRFESDWVAGPNRSGPPTEDKLIKSERDLAWLDFGGKLGIYDFTKDQHRSWTRSNHLSVRGERGEIFDSRIRIQDPACTQIELELKRINKGEYENAEGYFLKGIMAGERWVYENPFMPARLYDDEIAIAACLKKMAAYAAGGPSFYGLPEASQDHYIGMLIEQAVQSGETVVSVAQPWAEPI
ncbi:Gfo/Idh/MocA family protein [Paenibacillus agricola]|uniref:Gfo/Idh/MocA family oxidoreductase n=1 Tax=Paenibacillus agricola TaxID=2716264 RepID=A0ABX0J2G8_9BACL|nr:Gfo/Idh/MocA family oxidoreductase [Paenibacillus agricola]NHN30464.1 Gfo/Idh/MocA family oxidoreductase [Paenibacillus agricola]